MGKYLHQITELSETPASGDLILIQDVSDTADSVNGTTKRVTYSNLTSGLGGGSGISNVVEDTSPQLGGHLDVNGQAIGDGTRELLTFTEDGSAVNHINIENQATGSGPIISTAGDDSDVDLILSSKGTGNVTINKDLSATTASFSGQLDTAARTVINGTAPLGTLTIYGDNAADQALVIKAAASQSTTIWEVLESTGQRVFSVTTNYINTKSLLPLTTNTWNVGQWNLSYNKIFGKVLYTDPGTASAPSYNFHAGGDTLHNTGLFGTAAKLGMSVGGVEKASATTSGLVAGLGASLGTLTVYCDSDDSDSDSDAVGLVIHASVGQTADILQVQNGAGAALFKINSSGSIDTTSIVSTSDANITIAPNGTGNVILGTMTFDADQSIGAGQDNYVLTYDNSTGLVSLEAAAGGGSGDITAVNITTDSGAGSKASDTSGDADFSLLGGDGISVTNSGATITVALADPDSDNGSDIDEGVIATSDRLLIWDETANSWKYVTVDNLQDELDTNTGISNVVEDTTPQLGGHLDVNGQAIGDGTRELLTFTEDGSAVNHVNIENQATGGGPIISSAGDDTNVDLILSPKGSGNVGINTAAPNAKLSVNGSMSLPIEAISATDTLDDTNHTVLVNATSGVKTVNLPAASGATGKIFIIKKTDSSSNNVTIDPNASETIDGTSTFAFNAQNRAVTIQCDGSNWHIISSYIVNY